jgi:hypothetical protein
MRNERSRGYLAYLLRLERVADQAEWRVSLEAVSSNEVHRFRDLKAAVLFLRREMAPDGGEERR